MEHLQSNFQNCTIYFSGAKSVVLHLELEIMLMVTQISSINEAENFKSSHIKRSLT